MTVLTGTVVAGKIEVPDSVTDGARVMVLTLEPDVPLRLTAAEEDELTQALEEIRRGEYVDGRELLSELRALHGD